MFTFAFRWVSLVIFLIAPFSSRGVDLPAPSVPASAVVDVVLFEFNAEGETHKAIVSSAPSLVRVDEATDGYSVIYDLRTEVYTGLEHRNYTYWTFSWPVVRAAVEGSKRQEDRLQRLGNEGLNGDLDSSSVPVSGAATSSAGSDDSGYVWHPTNDRKRVAGLDCIRWTGDTVSGEALEAWCYAGLLPKVQSAIDQLRTINEPMALVPVRTIVPDFIFPVYAALEKGGVTPLLINWGGGADKNHFRFLEAKTRSGAVALFAVPKLYVKTTLITMDGMTNDQPPPSPAKSALLKTWQNP